MTVKCAISGRCPRFLTLAAIEIAFTGETFVPRAVVEKIEQATSATKPDSSVAAADAAVYRAAALCWFNRDQMHTDGLADAENAVVKERRRKKWDRRIALIPTLPADSLARIATATALDEVRRELEAAGRWHVKLIA